MSTNASDLRFPLRYYYVFRAINGTSVTVLRGQTPPKLTGGWGGWEIVARRRRRGMTTWTGRDPLQMDVPCLFDGWGVSPRNIDADVQTLRLMAVGDEFNEPPSVMLDGFAPAAGVRWVINDFEWGDDVKYARDPNTGTDIRVRQDVIVRLLQYSAEDTVKVIPTPGIPGLWYTQDGDTLRKIAKNSYGDGTKWTLIADANSSVARDPDAPLKPGITLRIPPLPNDPKLPKRK